MTMWKLPWKKETVEVPSTERDDDPAGNSIDLARRAMSCVDPLSRGLSALSDAEWRKVFIDCKKLLEFQTLTSVLNDLKCQQRDLIAKNATKETIDFARGVLVGIDTVESRLKFLASKASSKGGEKFDPNAII
jgi:hypothetical protein